MLTRTKRFLSLWPRIKQNWASGWIYEHNSRHAYLARDFKRYNKIQYFFAKCRAVWILSAHYVILENRLWRILSEGQYSSAAYDK